MDPKVRLIRGRDPATGRFLKAPLAAPIPPLGDPAAHKRIRTMSLALLMLLLMVLLLEQQFAKRAARGAPLAQPPKLEQFWAARDAAGPVVESPKKLATPAEEPERFFHSVTVPPAGVSRGKAAPLAAGLLAQREQLPAPPPILLPAPPAAAPIGGGSPDEFLPPPVAHREETGEEEEGFEGIAHREKHGGGDERREVPKIRREIEHRGGEERTETRSFARFLGISREELQEMRESGLSMKDIAHAMTATIHAAHDSMKNAMGRREAEKEDGPRPPAGPAPRKAIKIPEPHAGETPRAPVKAPKPHFNRGGED